MSDDSRQDMALLSFSLGPVQTFIESARTLRDLWAGSYLLAWLTAAGMKPVLETRRATMISPDVRDNDLVAAFLNTARREGATVPCLPNKFIAEVPAEGASALADRCVQSWWDEWKTIGRKVHVKLHDKFSELDSKWYLDWDAQLDSFFEVHCVVLPLAQCDPATLDRLHIPKNKDTWTRQMMLLGALMEMRRSVRHVPPYRSGRYGDQHSPGKCSLLGSFEQMGPASFGGSKEFWEKLGGLNWKGFGGSRLRKRDRLCALSLVKRFAWPAYFAGRLHQEVEKLRFADTATLAARRWLAEPPAIDPEQLRDDEGAWNGQWLHWPSDDHGEKDGDPRRPSELSARIREKVAQQGKPPTYYALLHMDGDDMGSYFRGEDDKGDLAWGKGADRYRAISGRLTRFAGMVRGIVERDDGELIYAGGDDVLALLPAREVVRCAGRLRAAYRSAECMGLATISAGIAVVHIKEDLRFALGQVREAEKRAKRLPKKDALSLTVCRRSGEHGSATLGWDQTEAFSQMVDSFTEGASDRWAYKLRTELPALGGEGLPWEARKGEVARLLSRADGTSEAFRKEVNGFLDKYHAEMSLRERKGADILTDFALLCQSASFLARGRD